MARQAGMRRRRPAAENRDAAPEALAEGDENAVGEDGNPTEQDGSPVARPRHDPLEQLEQEEEVGFQQEKIQILLLMGRGWDHTPWLHNCSHKARALPMKHAVVSAPLSYAVVKGGPDQFDGCARRLSARRGRRRSPTTSTSASGRSSPSQLCCTCTAGC